MNFSPIQHHPVHLHGHTFWVTGHEGARMPKSAWIPRNTELIAVAQASHFEFIAKNPGDPEIGKATFLSCLSCHKVGTEGQDIAPPLDGSGHETGPGGGKRDGATAAAPAPPLTTGAPAASSAKAMTDLAKAISKRCSRVSNAIRLHAGFLM